MSKAMRIGLLCGCYAIVLFVSYKTCKSIGEGIAEIIME